MSWSYLRWHFGRKFRAAHPLAHTNPSRLGMTHLPWNWSTEQWIPSDRGAGRPIIAEVMQQLQHHGWSEQEVFAVHLALEEAVVNAMLHGNRAEPGKQVHIICKLSDKRVWIEVGDEGPGFRPDEVPDCTQPENMEVPSGRGIMLMRSFMSRVEFNSCGNRVVLEKLRAGLAGSSVSQAAASASFSIEPL